MSEPLMSAGGDLLVDEPHVLDYKNAYLLTEYVLICRSNE